MIQFMMTTNQTLSIAFQTDKPITAYGPLAQDAESYGFDCVTVYNDLLYQPAWLPLMEMARATQRVRVGVAAVNPFTCHPINIAGNVALVDEAANGRAYLGIARGGWLDYLGMTPMRSITALREAFESVRHLLARSTEPYAGEIFPLAGGEALRWADIRADIPFLLGSWGEQTIRACINEVAEVKIGGSANPRLAPRYRQIMVDALGTTTERGQKRAGVGLVFGAVTVVDEDGEAARTLARREAALYLPIIATLDPTLGIEPELLTRIQEASARYDFDAVGTLISNELLQRLALAGTPNDIVVQTAALFEAGVTRVEFGTPHGMTPEVGMRLLGEKVLPAFDTAQT